MEQVVEEGGGGASSDEHFVEDFFATLEGDNSAVDQVMFSGKFFEGFAEKIFGSVLGAIVDSHVKFLCKLQFMGVKLDVSKINIHII